MKLVNSSYNLNMQLRENEITVLIVEEPRFMCEIVQGLYQQSLGQEGDFVLSESDQTLSIGKTFSIILDPFSLDFNDKKIINKIYADLQQSAVNFFEDKEKINSEMICMLDQIIGMSQYSNLVYNLELDWIQIMKLYNINIDVETSTVLEKILEYQKIIVNVLHHSILCLVNIKSYLCKEELGEIYKMANYLKLHLILIETREGEELEEEKIIIIDKDRCTIVK